MNVKNDTVDTINPKINENCKKYKIKKVPATERISRSDLKNNCLNGVLSFINIRVIIVYTTIIPVIAR